MNYPRVATFLKEIVVIVYALAFANGTLYFLQTSDYAPRGLLTFKLHEILLYSCFLFTLVRFFHGNLAYLASTYDIKSPRTRKGAIRLAADFFFIIIQAFLFCVLSVYQLQPAAFVWIFTVLFLFDGIWFSVSSFLCYSSHPNDRKQRDYLNHWAIFNIITAVILFIVIRASWSAADLSQADRGTAALPPLPFILLFSGVVLGNGAIDYFANRSVFFPFPTSGKRKELKIFLSARLTKAIRPDGTFDSATKSMVQKVVTRLREAGVTVFSAHLVEEFGRAIVPPEEFAPRDFEEICESDEVIILFDEPLSVGTCIEIGWATSMQKPVHIFAPESYALQANAPMLYGLFRIADVRIERYADISSLLAKIDKFKEGLIKR